MIFSPGLCGHFALGTLSETYLKDAVFEINVVRRKNKQTQQHPILSNLTPKSRNVSELDIIVSQLTHLDICHFIYSFFLSKHKSEN